LPNFQTRTMPRRSRRRRTRRRSRVQPANKGTRTPDSVERSTAGVVWTKSCSYRNDLGARHDRGTGGSSTAAS
jgi:hypothetical protein